MNHYRFIILQIQDLSTSNFIHSVTSYNDMEKFELSTEPIKYYVDANNLSELLEAKEIMSAVLNSIYEVEALSRTTTELVDGYEEFVMEKTPAYLDNITYYNAKLIFNVSNEATKKAYPEVPIKKINKNRFQIIESFANGKPKVIELFDRSNIW